MKKKIDLPFASQYMRAMKPNGDFEIFLTAPPGLEAVLCDEVKAQGFRAPKAVPGGVRIEGRWHDVWRANLVVRGANRVLARLDSFRVEHLDKLEQRARRVPWAGVLRPDVPFRVEATCARSRIYHTGAAAERIARAIAAETGAPHAVDADADDEAGEEDAAVTVTARLDNNVCTISLDTSGALLHKRGFKEAVAKAPLRETFAALLLRQCGYDGTETVYDPMCGSGTFVIEAAEIAARLAPGRARSFAFEHLATFDAARWQALREAAHAKAMTPAVRAYGSDRDPNAIAMSRANAARAGVAGVTAFEPRSIGTAGPPGGPPGLVILNPPYGTRIGDRKKLNALYRAIGARLREAFAGWRVGMITSEPALAKATGLPFLPPGPPVPHGGLRITLYRTGTLG